MNDEHCSAKKKSFTNGAQKEIARREQMFDIWACEKAKRQRKRFT